MNVLLLGSGGREHAISWALSKSPKLGKLFAAPGSDAIGRLAERVAVSPLDPRALIGFCEEKAIDLVVVGPEEPLARGVTDELRAAGISCFGPGAAAAQLESSKAFAKSFLERHGIPTARSARAAALQEALLALRLFPNGAAVKADGLASGKGVFICPTRRLGEEALYSLLEQKTLGAAGETVVIEELLEGPEISWLGFCDGKNFLCLPSASDHKRLLDGDLGPNTGGMGVVAPSPFSSPALAARIEAEIVQPTLAGLAADGLDYRGLLYIGLMITPSGPKVLEFNARFGDPETQALLPLLKTDLLELLSATAERSLSGRILDASGAAATVVLASEGYPAAPALGRPISGIDAAEREALVFHAGTKIVEGVWRTAGGRVLGVTGLGPDLASARQSAYAAAEKISFTGRQMRRDIGAPAAVLEKSA